MPHLPTTSFQEQLERQHLGGMQPKGFERYVQQKAILDAMPVQGEHGNFYRNPDCYKPVSSSLENDFPRRGKKR